MGMKINHLTNIVDNDMPAIDKEFNNEVQESIKESIRESREERSIRDAMMEVLLNENTRLISLPVLASLFCDILLFRLSSKKEKIGYLTATVNQITIGVNITKEILNGTEFDNNTKG